MNDVFVFYSHLFYCRVLLHNLIRDGKYTCSVVSAANIGELRQRVFLWLILHREGIASALYARQEVMCVCVCVFVCVECRRKSESGERASRRRLSRKTLVVVKYSDNVKLIRNRCVSRPQYSQLLVVHVVSCLYFILAAAKYKIRISQKQLDIYLCHFYTYSGILCGLMLQF